MNKKSWTSFLIERIEPLKKSKPVGPLVVEIAPTRGCNHKCIHCGFQQYSPYSNKKQFLPLHIYKSFVDDFVELGGKEIWFAGNGEPFLNPSFSDMVKYGAKKGLSIGVSSNVVNVDEQIVEDIIEHISWTKFSINGANEKTYSKVHQCNPKDFKRAIENIQLFTTYRNKSNNKPFISIQFIVMKENWMDIKQMVDIHTKLDVDKLIFRNVIKKEYVLVPIPNDVKNTLSQISHIKTIFINWNSFNEKPISNWTTCFGINFRINLSENGDLYTCCRDLTIPSIYGNIFENSFFDIWHSKRKKEIFENIYNFKDRSCCIKWCQCASDNIFIDNFFNN